MEADIIEKRDPPEGEESFSEGGKAAGNWVSYPRGEGGPSAGKKRGRMIGASEGVGGWPDRLCARAKLRWAARRGKMPKKGE